MKIYRKSSIKKDLIVSIGLTVLAVGLFVGILSYFFSIRNISVTLQRGAEDSSRELAEILSEPLWNFNTETIALVCKTSFESPGTAGVRVIDHKGRALFEQGDFNTNDVYLSSRHITFRNTKIGEVYIAVSKRVMETKKREALITTIAFVLGSIVPCIFIIYYMLHIVFSRRFVQLQDIISNISDGNYDVALPQNPKSEIQVLLDDFKSLSSKLKDRERDIQEKNTYLQSINEMLQKEINQRKEQEAALEKAYNEIELYKRRLEDDNIFLREEIKQEYNYEEIIGNSIALQKVLQQVEKVSKTDTAVLVLGESGVGKELIVRAIHNSGTRSDRPMIKINCAAIPDHLIESELFGHEKGAFSGADKRRLGRFEVAHESTLFLDEVGELPLSLQSKLLRVLESGEFERLGSNKTIKTDVRIIAASNRNLNSMVNTGEFRLDLLHRLNVFTIHVPPLRSRKEDIAQLVDHFVEKLGKKLGIRVSHITSSAMEELAEYDWPGNIRELAHVLERSIICATDSVLRELELPRSMKSPQIASDPAIKTMERDHIKKVMIQTNWIIEGPRGAAKVLDMSPSTLRYRLKKFGLKKDKL